MFEPIISMRPTNLVTCTPRANIEISGVPPSTLYGVLICLIFWTHLNFTLWESKAETSQLITSPMKVLNHETQDLFFKHTNQFVHGT